MSTFRNNFFSDFESSCWSRDEGFAAFTALPWAHCPHYGPDGTAALLHIGAERFDHVAPGFEGCLDAPIRMPAGSVKAVGFQPYMD